MWQDCKAYSSLNSNYLKMAAYVLVWFWLIMRIVAEGHVRSVLRADDRYVFHGLSVGVAG